MSYDVKGKIAIVTGGGSGISLCFIQRLLEAGCSVAVADLQLRPEASTLLAKYPHPPTNSDTPSAIFIRTDMSNWQNISCLWESALKTFGRIDIVMNGAGVIDPPFSNFWEAPGISPRSKDPADAQLGQYMTVAINLVGPMRLTQIALDYWLQNRNVKGNLPSIASVAAYTPYLAVPFYHATKAGLMGFFRSLGMLNKEFGIRNAMVCPGAVFTPIMLGEKVKDLLKLGDVALMPDDVADLMMRVLQEPEYGDGNVMEIIKAGTPENQSVRVRNVPVESLHPRQMMYTKRTVRVTP